MSDTRYTTNDRDTVYYQPSSNSFRVAFLVTSEFFDPTPAVAERLKLVCDALNASDEKKL